MLTDTTDQNVSGSPTREDDVEPSERFVTGSSKASVSEPQGGDEMGVPKLQIAFQELMSLRKDEKDRFTRLEKALKELKPAPSNIDPTTNLWAVYQKASDEHENGLLNRYSEDLGTSLLFAGLFSAVTTAFIVQIAPATQPNPVDLTNVLLLRLLQQDVSFGGSDPLAPVSNVSSSVVKAQSILFASLAVTLFVAFLAVLGKQWILYYPRTSSIVDRGKERQVKFAGLQKWRLHFIISILLQLALLLFTVGMIVYLWNLVPSAAEVMLATACTGSVFYTCIAVITRIWSDSTFQAPFSLLLTKVWHWIKRVAKYVRAWFRRQPTPLLPQAERMAERVGLASPIGHVRRTFFGGSNSADPVIENVHDERYMKLSNPSFWRQDPLFTSPLPKDTAASAGVWLLENSTEASTATAVAAAFSQFQWQPHHHSTIALTRLRDTYTDCFRTHVFDDSARLKALQCATAYYVLYHTRLIWSTSQSCEVEVERPPPNLPHDLFLFSHSEEWNGYDLFEYLLRIEDRSEPVTSARFLAYIAPFWFCGDSDPAVRFRSSRLDTLDQLIAVLDGSQALVPASLTDCVLCVGATMDFPLHAEDLIRVDKSYHFVPTFKAVVEHIYDISLARGRRYRHAAHALEILLTLVGHTTLPVVGAAWINELLRRAVVGEMADEEFILFLRLSSWRAEEGAMLDTGLRDPSPVLGFGINPLSLGRTMISEVPTPDHTLFNQIMNIQVCVERDHGWRDEAIYGGLVAIRDIRRLDPSLIDDATLQTFHGAMSRGNPFRVRQAAYHVMLVTQNQWLKSERLRQRLEDLDFFRQMYGVVVETARSDYQRSFLTMMDVLSQEVYWHPYLRKAMDIWLRFRREGPSQTLRIIANICGLSLAERGDQISSSLDDLLQNLMVDEWRAVPGRPAHDLTTDRLRPLVEVTERFNALLFDGGHRAEVLTEVEQVIPGLERRYDSGYEGPEEEVRRIVDDLLTKLRLPSKRRFTDD